MATGLNMRHFKKIMITMGAVFSLCSFSQAQSFGGTNLGFQGMSGYLGFGVAEFSVLNPANNFRMDQGQYLYLAGEKPIGMTGLSITFSVNFMETGGQSFYDYTTLGGTQYQNDPSVASEIDFDSEHLQLGIGFKFKIFPTSWFRPYGEAGGLFGYHTINYSPSAGEITPNDGGFKDKDALVGFGYYGEAGVEIDFSEAWGIRTGIRYQITETREFETLANQSVEYEVRAFQFGIGRKF